MVNTKRRMDQRKGIEPTIKADYPEYAYLKLIPRDKTLKDQSEDIQNLNAIVLAYPVDKCKLHRRNKSSG